MPNIGVYEHIDYNELIEDLKEDLDSGFMTDESPVYAVRSDYTVTLKNINKNFSPVLDFLYADPKLQNKLVTMTVTEAKKLMREVISNLAEDESAKGNALKESSQLLLKDLEDYTKMNKKRGERPVKLLMTEPVEGYGACPMNLYYQEDDAADEVELTTAKALMNEFVLCNG